MHDLLLVQVSLPFLYVVCSLCLLFMQWSSFLNGVSKYRCRWGYTPPGQEMSMLDVLVVVLAFYFCLANWVFCNPFSTVWAVCIDQCMYGYFEDDCIIYYTALRHHLLLNHWNLNVLFNSIKPMKTGCYIYFNH